MRSIFRNVVLFFSVIFFSSCVFANSFTNFFTDTFTTFLTPPCSRLVLQGGWFDAYLGKSQHIDIDGLIGNQYTVNHHHSQSGLGGLGWYINGFDSSDLTFLYGINAFYLGPTHVKGEVIQEEIFENLAYTYQVVNYPVYAATKIILKHNCYFDFTFDLGVGVNAIQARHFRDRSIDGGVTIPDRPFTDHTQASFSLNTGVGIQIGNAFGGFPLECGYRFFYLGQGEFGKRTNQLLDNLKTGHGYANAIVCSVSV